MQRGASTGGSTRCKGAHSPLQSGWAEASSNNGRLEPSAWGGGRGPSGAERQRARGGLGKLHARAPRPPRHGNAFPQSKQGRIGRAYAFRRTLHRQDTTRCGRGCPCGMEAVLVRQTNTCGTQKAIAIRSEDPSRLGIRTHPREEGDCSLRAYSAAELLGPAWTRTLRWPPQAQAPSVAGRSRHETLHS